MLVDVEAGGFPQIFNEQRCHIRGLYKVRKGSWLLVTSRNSGVRRSSWVSSSLQMFTVSGVVDVNPVI